MRERKRIPDADRGLAESTSFDWSAIDWDRLFAELGLDSDERGALECKALGLRGSDALQFIGSQSYARFRNTQERLRKKLGKRSPCAMNLGYVSTNRSRRPWGIERLESGHRCYVLDRLDPGFQQVMAAERPLVRRVDSKTFLAKRVFCPKVEGRMQHRTVQFELKDLTENGTFSGILSTYGGKPDLGGDVVVKGAFAQTLAANNGRIPLLVDHDSSKQIGLLKLTDTPEALQAQGVLNMELPLAQEVRSKLRFNLSNGIKTGLSIGYLTVKDFVADGVRYLKQLDLYEGSVVLFPMNPSAMIQNAKRFSETEKAEIATLARAIKQVYSEAIDQGFRRNRFRDEVRGFFDQPGGRT